MLLWLVGLSPIFGKIALQFYINIVIFRRIFLFIGILWRTDENMKLYFIIIIIQMRSSTYIIWKLAELDSWLWVISSGLLIRIFQQGSTLVNYDHKLMLWVMNRITYWKTRDVLWIYYTIAEDKNIYLILIWALGSIVLAVKSLGSFSKSLRTSNFFLKQIY